MNKRLYELINQCFIGTTDGKLSDLNTVANIEKFAELIILECASICYKSSFDDSDAHAMNLLYEFNIDGAREWK